MLIRLACMVQVFEKMALRLGHNELEKKNSSSIEIHARTVHQYNKHHLLHNGHMTDVQKAVLRIYDDDVCKGYV